MRCLHRICPYHAKKAVTDSLDTIKNYKYKIALPAPALYGQYGPEFSRERIVLALKQLGFDYVFEVARAAEIVTNLSDKYMKNKDIKKPVISSACPAVVRFIQIRFPNLIENLLKIESPMEIAAALSRQEVHEKFGIPYEDMGVFFISPCAAKVTSVKAPYESQKSNVDAVIAIKDIYLILRNHEKGR